MNVNWKVRLKNPYFWITIVPLIVTEVWEILGWFHVIPTITENDFTNSIMRIVKIVFIIIGGIGVANDPTTEGLDDSTLAMTYKTPKVKGA